MSDTRTATAYLQIEGKDPGPNYDSGRRAIIRSVHNKRPQTVRSGCIVVKVQLQIPTAAWLPISPEAVVVVPESLVQHPVEVEAVDANE